jgi:hypothetical protein
MWVCGPPTIGNIGNYVCVHNEDGKGATPKGGSSPKGGITV